MFGVSFVGRKLGIDDIMGIITLGCILLKTSIINSKYSGYERERTAFQSLFHSCGSVIAMTYIKLTDRYHRWAPASVLGIRVLLL